MGQVKTVLDTNVLVSILFKKTLAREFSQAIEKQKIEIYTSKEILKELVRVMTYPKIESIFRNSGINKRSALVSLTERLKVVEPKKRINIIKVDPSDNRILECGIEAKVKYIVSGNKHLLRLRKFKNIEIITPREFLEKIR
jgi:putative PIN family toxin of toxin-antitoxin system